MSWVIVDPYLLMLPHGDDLNAETVEEFATNYSRWEKDLRNKRLYTFSAWARDAIPRELRPTRQNLTALFARYGITHLSADLIAARANGILANAAMEQMAGYYDSPADNCPYCLEEPKVFIPAQMHRRLGDVVATSFSQALVCCGFLCERKSDKRVWSIGAAPLKSENADRLRIEASVWIERDGVEREYAKEWPLLFSPEHLLLQLKLHDWYREDPALAARIQYSKMRAEGGRVQWNEQRTFAFGPRFAESIHRSFTDSGHFSYALGKLFEAIVHVLGETYDFGEGQNHQLCRFVNRGPRITKPNGERVD